MGIIIELQLCLQKNTKDRIPNNEGSDHVI